MFVVIGGFLVVLVVFGCFLQQVVGEGFEGFDKGHVNFHGEIAKDTAEKINLIKILSVDS